MSLEINQWSVVPSDNNFAPPDGAPESTTKLSHLNNIIREIMAVIARWSKDTSYSILVSSGTGQNFTLSLNRSLTSYIDCMSFVWRNHVTNQANPTLSLNGLAGKALVDLDIQPIRAGKLNGKIIQTTYSLAYDKFIVTNYRDEKTLPIGTTMTFMASAAPVGWQQVTGWHDFMLRIVGDNSGLGGGGSWNISGLSTENTAHYHYFEAVSSVADLSIGVGNGANGVAVNGHHHIVAGNTGTESALHTHVGDGTWRPAYINAIVCIRID